MKMKKYERPIVLTNEELAEGVYAASGDTATKKSCDSKYMNGVWHGMDYTTKDSEGYLARFGCLGCRANRFNSCGLVTDYVANNEASSYDDDAGNRMPEWERKGYGPNDTVTDYNCG
jgi:hypothetical protein